jgi:cellulose synthase/poly-beta-1,6-N-acetylglucosamine synthase-like glycosyltransferase
MLTTITVLFISIYLLDILVLFIFGLHTLLMVQLYRQYKQNCVSDPSKILSGKEKNLPKVTVQLPIYNEFYVVERLLEAAVALKYPYDKLEIQLLDDSTDETIEKARNLISLYQKKGIPIKHLHRTDRTGHKAGALEKGLEQSSGEFIAIFDADFIPEPDFLLKTVGYFSNPEIGMVQARWGHINQDYNLLTKAQGYGIDGHFMIEQVARNGAGLWMNFNGTAGIWRRACIEDAGGWEHDTLTEDFDLSYRAELKGWKFQYLKDVVCKAEIPAMISAYKSQQFRWCKGSIQTAVKLLPKIWSSDLPLKVKSEAIMHLINYSVHPLMIINILFTAPLLLMEFWTGMKLTDIPVFALFATAAFMSVGSIGPIVFYAYSQKEIYGDWKSRIYFLPVMIMIGTGVAVVNTKAWLEAVLGIQSSFKRTPKLKIESKTDKIKEKLKYTVPFDSLTFLEIFMGIYCLFCVYVSIVVEKPMIIGFLFIYSLGFFFVAFSSIRDAYLGLRANMKEKLKSAEETVQVEIA